jgi:glycerol uptake facilitator protein
MWGVLAVGDRRNAALSKAGPFVVGGVVLVIGLCLGGPSGYAINPARDLGPRLFGLVAGTKGLFDGLYWLIPPVLIPFVAAPIGGYLYDLIFASEKEPKPAVSLKHQPGSAD